MLIFFSRSGLRRSPLILAALALCQPACKSARDPGRPFEIHAPPSYRADRPAPLLLLLHGYTANGVSQEVYFQVQKLAQQHGFLYVAPDGRTNRAGERFWSATDACCDLDRQGGDDVEYLRSVLRQARARYNVDPGRVFVLGHSNGGFMAYRLACEAAGEVRAVVSLAGAMWRDSSRCQPTAPVAVLQIHGDADDVIRYEGGRFRPELAPYPSAHDTVAWWARHNRCLGDLTATGERLDLEPGLPGAETRVDRYAGCRARVELWTIKGGDHVPRDGARIGAQVYEFLRGLGPSTSPQ